MQTKHGQLRELMGFSEKKAQIYLTLLELGEVGVTDLAKQCGLKRTTVYNILPELQQEGLVRVTKRNGKRYFYVNDTRDLERIMEEKMSGVKKLIPELKKFHNLISRTPKITLYEGVGGMKQLYQDIIDDVSPGSEISTYIGLDNFEKYIPKEITQKYIQKRIDKKVRNRIITLSGKNAANWSQTAIKESREMKFIDAKDPFSADIKIFSNKIALLSYKENFFGVVIESLEINAFLTLFFEQLWKLLPDTKISS